MEQELNLAPFLLLLGNPPQEAPAAGFPSYTLISARLIPTQSYRSGHPLFPFDGTDGLGGQVVDHPVDARHLAGNASGNLVEQLVGNLLDSGGHGICGVHRSDDGGQPS